MSDPRSDSAPRTASSKPSRSKGISRPISSSSTTTSLTMESTSERPALASTSVMRLSQCDDSLGDSSGTGSRNSGRFSTAATRRIMSE